MESSKGFTLVELMIVIALIAIVSTIAVPSYQAMMQNGRETSARNSLVGALQWARSEAIVRRTEVSVTTNGNNWDVSAAGQVIRQVPFPASANAAAVNVVFRADGRPTASVSPIIIGAGKQVAVNSIGRASVSLSPTTPPSGD